MSLTRYKKKREFSETPEPTGGKSSRGQLRFVVQKHAASHLHYDFRVEMEGVLKSWAVPKGPSLDPSIKRLAMMVEDHPYDYRTFEGTIPEGNYGAGTVIVWDEGIYASTKITGGKAEHDKDLRHQLHQGKISFLLNGKKLKGEFVLLKNSSRGENAWLLKKVVDEFASTEDITGQDKSVRSGKTIRQLQKAVKKSTIRKTSAKKNCHQKETLNNVMMSLPLNELTETQILSKIREAFTGESLEGIDVEHLIDTSLTLEELFTKIREAIDLRNIAGAQ